MAKAGKTSASLDAFPKEYSPLLCASQILSVAQGCLVPAGTCSAREPLVSPRRGVVVPGAVPHIGAKLGTVLPPLGCSPSSFSLPCPSRAFSWAAARRHHACMGAADTVLGPGWALPVCSCCRHAPVRSANSYCSMICGFISNCCPSEEPHPPSLFVVLSLVPSGSRQPQVYFGFAWLQK